MRDYGVAGQLGLEPTADDYVQKLCDVFDEVKRVLKPNGTCWVNLGDTYASDGMGNKSVNEPTHGRTFHSNKQAEADQPKPRRSKAGVPPKSLALIPFRFALEMVQRGWTLRNTLIWHKPNALPASVKDRFTVDFEYLFFFTKAARYWFEPQFEPLDDSTVKRVAAFRRNQEKFNPARHKHDDQTQIPYQVLERIAMSGLNPLGRNKRCVWTIPTQPFKGAHFATFPERLAEIPIKAGCPRFLCKRCGQARVKVFATRYDWQTAGKTLGPKRRADVTATIPGHATKRVTEAGWKQCDCRAGFVAGIVLDPFFGTGTTGLVAHKLGRHFLGIELNPDYVRMARARLTGCTRGSKL